MYLTKMLYFDIFWYELFVPPSSYLQLKAPRRQKCFDLLNNYRSERVNYTFIDIIFFVDLLNVFKSIDL